MTYYILVNTLLNSRTAHLIDDAECRPFQWAVELIGKRWNSGILLALSQGATRFSEIVARVDGLSDRMLSQRAKELEAAGLIARHVVATGGEFVTDLLVSLQPVLEWEQRWRDTPAS